MSKKVCLHMCGCVFDAESIFCSQIFLAQLFIISDFNDIWCTNGIVIAWFLFYFSSVELQSPNTDFMHVRILRSYWTIIIIIWVLLGRRKMTAKSMENLTENLFHVLEIEICTFLHQLLLSRHNNTNQMRQTMTGKNGALKSDKNCRKCGI